MNNTEIFRRAWEICKKNGFTFISSNGGTGKTTTFLFFLIRHALKTGEGFHVFVRYGNQRDSMAERILTPQPSYSKRMRTDLEKLAIERDGDKFVYLIEKATKRRIAQILDVYGQAFYKPYGNTINARFALFDEILAENGDYVPDEINRFMRLVFTMARSNVYHVIGLYNNTSPNFDYFRYFGGKSYTTHTAKSGAQFIYFTARQFSSDRAQLPPNSAQAIIANTQYNAVYNKNSFTQYPALFYDCDLNGSPKAFKLLIQSRVFTVRIKDNFIFLQRSCKNKSNKTLYTINEFTKRDAPVLPFHLCIILKKYAQESRLKTDNINDTVFVKILENFL